MRKNKLLLTFSIILLLAFYYVISGNKEHNKSLKDEVLNDNLGPTTKTVNITEFSSSDEVINGSALDLYQKAVAIDSFLKSKNVAINFYGKIIDQNENPIEGVTITAEISSYNDRFMTTTDSNQRSREKIKSITDETGSFSLTGLTGMTLTLEKFTKEGFKPSMRNRTFSYHVNEKGSTDPNNPTVYTMWKQKGETEGLIKMEKTYRFKPGNEITVDLLSSKARKGIANGDFYVQINRPEDATSKKPFNWNIKIRAANGGILDTDDLFLYEAPIDGYKDTFDLEIKKEDSNWRSSLNKQFYLKSRNGEVYSSLKVEFIPRYNGNVAIRLKWLTNPNGSRNLEFDQSKNLTSKYLRN